MPARLVGQQAKTGSVKVGKAADLALVDGDPSSRIGDLRQTRVVMLDCKVLDADALRTRRQVSQVGPSRVANGYGRLSVRNGAFHRHASRAISRTPSVIA